MSPSERWYTAINLIWATTIMIVIFMVGSCQQNRDNINYRMEQTVRLECIRNGGSWGVVSQPDASTRYGCVKK